MSNFDTPSNVTYTSHKVDGPLKVRFEKLSSDAVTPSYSREGDAGLDLIAVRKSYTHNYIEYGTDIAVEIPAGYVGLLFPRSSITNTAPGVSMKNSVGVIDSGYRGEIKIRLESPSVDFVWDDQAKQCISLSEFEVDGFIVRDLNDIVPTPNPGEKIAQLLIVPYQAIELVEADELTNTTRGNGGFGSTGK